MRRTFALLVALLVPLPALAHPHVMIDAHVVALFEHGKITALQMGWKFDPVYSSSLVKDFDADKSGTLSAAEIAAIEKEGFQNTREYNYFTYAKIDGKPVEWPQATDFKVLVQKDALVYAFRLTLPQPIDPRQQAFKLATYEETYYIDLDLPNDDAAKLIGEGSENCRAVIGQDKETPLFGGVVFPRKFEVSCR